MKTFSKRYMEAGTCCNCLAFTLLIPEGELRCPKCKGFKQCRKCGTFHRGRSCPKCKQEVK